MDKDYTFITPFDIFEVRSKSVVVDDDNMTFLIPHNDKTSVDAINELFECAETEWFEFVDNFGDKDIQLGRIISMVKLEANYFVEMKVKGKQWLH